MKYISRRQMLATTGLTVGGGLLAVHSNKSQANNNSENTTQQEKAEAQTDLLLNSPGGTLQYTPIASNEAAARTYQLYPEGSCMYAVAKGIISTFADSTQATISPVFYNMFKYGHGGCGGWGSLCGACNGAAAVLGLFCEDKKVRDGMLSELFRWYESTLLPEYAPGNSTDTEFPVSAAKSILCHMSTNEWCTEADEDVFSKARKERCGRLSADVAKKTVEILNTHYAANQANTEDQKAACKADQAACPADSCVECHSTRNDEPSPKVSTKMDCSKCHEVETDHPK